MPVVWHVSMLMSNRYSKHIRWLHSHGKVRPLSANECQYNASSTAKYVEIYIKDHHRYSPHPILMEERAWAIDVRCWQSQGWQVHVFSFATVLQSGPPNSVHSVASIACANSNVNTLNPIPCWHSIRFFLGNPQPYLPVILFAMKFRLEGPVDHGVGSSWHPWLRNSRRTSVSCHLIFFVSWSQDYVAKKSEKDVQEMSRESVAKLWFGDWIVWGPVLPDISQLDYPGIPIIMYLWWCCPKFQIWLQGPVAPSIDPIKHKCPTLQVSSGKWAKYHKSSIPFWNLHRTQTWKSTSVKHGAQRLSKHRAHQQWTAQGLRMMLCVTILSWTHDNALFAIIDSMASNLNTAYSSIRSFILMGKTR